MRCPNCGNENPADYTFCDECGAKLGPQEGEASAAGMPVQQVATESSATYVPAGALGSMAAPDSGGLNSAPLGGNGANSMGMDPGMQQNGSAPLAGGTCPNCGAATVPGEAYCNECGAELPTAGASLGAGDNTAASTPMSSTELDAEPAPAPVASAGSVGEQSGMAPYIPEAVMGGTEAIPSADEAASTIPGSPEGSGREIPPTEETMQAPTPEYAAPGMGDAPMPGVMPILGANSGSTLPEAMPQSISMEASPASTGVAPADTGMSMDAGAPAPIAVPGASQDTGPWATHALNQLEEAQQSMGRGDWAAYGQTMNDLKTFLESVAGGTASAMPASMEAPQAPAPATNGNASAIGVQAPEAAGVVPLVEPAAEVGVPAASMPQPPAQAPQKAAGAGAGMSRLVVISSGAELPLPQQEEITVGREDPSSGIFPDIDLTPYGGEDGGVSRRHARLLHIGNDYFVEDLQSTNYTKIDGQRLPARVREKLEDGARLDFGRVALIFRKA